MFQVGFEGLGLVIKSIRPFRRVLARRLFRPSSPTGGERCYLPREQSAGSPRVSAAVGPGRAPLPAVSRPPPPSAPGRDPARSRSVCPAALGRGSPERQLCSGLLSCPRERKPARPSRPRGGQELPRVAGSAPPALVSPGLHGSARRSREAPEGGSLVGCRLRRLSKAGTKVTSRSLKTFFYYFHSPFLKGQVSETQIIPPAQDSPAICQAGEICIANRSKCNLRESYSEYCFD